MTREKIADKTEEAFMSMLCGKGFDRCCWIVIAVAVVYFVGRVL